MRTRSPSGTRVAVKEWGVDANEKLGIYVSVPFCRAKCSFCNFASGVGAAGAMEAYVPQLCAEIEAAGETAAALGVELPREVDTVYFGGGTPSLLSQVQMEQIFAALRGQFAVAQDAEITMEAAPGQIEGRVLDAAMALGVNRVSLGVQSFIDRECQAIGRFHTGKECVREIVRLRAAGVAEVGADLIAGLPYQDAASWETSLDFATEVGLTHLSVYMLEVDEDSRLGLEVLAGGERFHAPRVPTDELSAEMYERACERLPRAGFAQYEISNFAACDHRSRHNVKYWQRAPYMGFGLDAHSMLRRGIGAVRFANPDELAMYTGAKSSREVTQVGIREAFEETMFLGLRMAEGVDVVSLRGEFGRAMVDDCAETVRELVADGMMTEGDGCWRLTLRGRMVSNEVFGALLMQAVV